MSVMNPAPMIVPWFAIASWLFYVMILLAIVIGIVVFMVKTVKYLKGIHTTLQRIETKLNDTGKTTE
jgi:heme exporter protein D